MGLNVGDSWRAAWDRQERWLTWVVWGVLFASVLWVLYGPSPSSEGLALLLALALMLVLGVSVLFQVWHFRRWLLTTPALLIVWAVLALINAWPLWDPAARQDNGSYVVWQMLATFVLWAVLGLRLVLRDTGLGALVGTVTVMAWSMALANLAVGGPGRLLLLLVSESGRGPLWWLDTVLSGLMCVGPLAPLTIVGWVGVRLVREFSDSGPL